MPTWWNLCNNPNSTGFGEFLGWWRHLHAGWVTHPNFAGIETLALGTPLGLALHISSSDCLVITFIISFIINQQMCFLEFCELCQQITEPEEGSWEPWFIVGQLKVPEVGTALWDWVLNLWDLMLTLGRHCQNWLKLLDTQLVSEKCFMGGRPTHLVLEVLWMW